MSINYSDDELKKYNEAYLKRYLKTGDYEEALERLNKGEPIQYIVGDVSFYGYQIKVDPRVLIPRFETEELVEKTLKYLKDTDMKDVIDLGTGSGCIAIALKKECPNLNVTAVDISSDALALAKVNAKDNDAKINFIKSDMLDAVTGKFDVIISNPPYIAIDEEIMDVVKNNEPHLALYAPNNGLYFYDLILKTCHKNIKDKYLIAFEIGDSLGEDITSLAHQYLGDVDVQIAKDMQGRNRFIFIRGGLWK